MLAFLGRGLWALLGLGCLGPAVVGCGGSTESDLEIARDAGGSAEGGSRSTHEGGTRTTTAADGGSSRHDATKTVSPEAGKGAPEAAPPADSHIGYPDNGTVHLDAGGGDDAGASCPTAEPTGACPVAEQVCHYGASACECTAMMEWACRTCPATMPTVGATCTATTGGMGAGAAATCRYGTTDCACTDGAWACGSCPTATPTENSACTVEGETCAYDGGDCRCARAGMGGGMGGGGGGGGDAWRCGGGMGTGMGGTCPTTQPAAGAACTGNERCMYTATTGDVTCTCSNDKFACN